MSAITYLGINALVTLSGLGYALYRAGRYPSTMVYGCFLANSAVYLLHH